MVTPTPTLIPLPIIISEVFPKPSQGEEWIELYNPNASTINLSGWELWDELSQPSLIFSFTTQTIGGNQWLIIPIARKLNDAEDGVTLKNSAGSTQDSMHYVSSETDMSWARLGTTATAPWNLSAASPGTSNPIPTATPQPTATPTPTTASTPVPTNTPTLSKTPTPSLTPTLTKSLTITPTSIQKTSHSAAAAQPQLKNLTQTFNTPSLTQLPTPTQIPITPTLIPTISLEKPTPPPKKSQTTNSKLLSLYFLGLTLIQLSAIGMSLTKQGMIKPDAVAPIP